jgi:hypothetical protein
MAAPVDERRTMGTIGGTAESDPISNAPPELAWCLLHS